MAMNSNQIVQTLGPIVDALEQLSVPYHLGGSVASSLYGQPRSTQDVDLIADLPSSLVRPFVKLLENDYYVVEDAIRDAIRHRSSFNLISHLTFMKVDIFIPKLRAFDQDAFHHGVRQRAIEPGGRLFPVGSPEVIVLNKLEWYEMGGRVSQRQWNDLIGVLKAQGPTLHLTYLAHWATVLQVTDLLEQALVEAGLKQP